MAVDVPAYLSSGIALAAVIWSYFATRSQKRESAIISDTRTADEVSRLRSDLNNYNELVQRQLERLTDGFNFNSQRLTRIEALSRLEPMEPIWRASPTSKVSNDKV